MRAPPLAGSISPDGSALSYANRRGDVYYLHAGKTKTGKARYFVAKTVGGGALAAMPRGFQFTESVNAVVSVARFDPHARAVPAQDLDLVRADLARHPHLRFHRADAVKGEIVVFEPIGAFTVDGIAAIAAAHRMDPEWVQRRMAGLRARTQYAPVMKFAPAGADGYCAKRMTYRGSGGWSWPLAHGPLEDLLDQHLRHIGTETFFDLM